MSDLSFHVRHEVTPDRVWEVLAAVAGGYSFDPIVQSDRQLSRLRQLGLVESASIRLTTIGLNLYQVGANKRHVAYDLLHYLHYTLWSQNKPLENTPYWTYRKFCEMLYEKSTCNLDLSTRDALTADLNNAINETFGHRIRLSKKGSLSLSNNSLSGIQHWLTVLTPPAIDNNFFALRQFCSPELLLLSIGYLITETGMELDVDVLLSPENRIFLEKICIIDNGCLDKVLDWTLNLYPNLITPGTRTGSYGRFIHLEKLPVFADFISV